MIKDQYFRHDYNASEDDKMIILLHDHGMLGYGIFWFMCEKIARSGGSLNIKTLPALAKRMNISLDLLESIVFKYGLFYKENECIKSDRLIRDLIKRSELSKNGKKGAIKANKSKHESNKLTLEDRRKQFGLQLSKFIGTDDGQYTKETIREFFDYWSAESLKKKNKMLWETKETFVIAKRLATWKKLGSKYNNNQDLVVARSNSNYKPTL